nr:hypothetical protein [Hymenobacter terricola]
MPDFRPQDSLKRHLFLGYHGHGACVTNQAAVGFHPNKAGANNDHLPGRFSGLQQRNGIGLGAQGQHAGQVVPGQLGQLVRNPSEGQQQLVVVKRRTVFELNFLLFQIEARGAGIGQKLDFLLRVKRRFPQRQCRRLGLPGQEGFAEFGTVVGRGGIGRYEYEAPRKAFLPQGLGRKLAGRPAADDNEGARIGRGRNGHCGRRTPNLRRGRGIGIADTGGRVERHLHPDAALGLAHGKGGQRIQRGRLAEAAVRHPKTGVVPGTDNPARYQLAFFQRRTVVRAVRRKGVHYAFVAGQQHGRPVVGRGESAQLALKHAGRVGQVDFGKHGIGGLSRLQRKPGCSG